MFYAFQVALVVKNPPTNAGDIRDTNSTPGSGRSPEEGHGKSHHYVFPEESYGQRTLAGYRSQRLGKD